MLVCFVRIAPVAIARLYRCCWYGVGRSIRNYAVSFTFRICELDVQNRPPPCCDRHVLKTKSLSLSRAPNRQILTRFSCKQTDFNPVFMCCVEMTARSPEQQENLRVFESTSSTSCQIDLECMQTCSVRGLPKSFTRRRRHESNEGLRVRRPR